MCVVALFVTGCRIVLFVYMNNILIIFHPDYKNDTLNLTDIIYLHFEFCFKEEGDIFIGIKIL